MSWKSDLAELIRQSWRPGQEFKLDQVYIFEAKLRELHPENGHIRDKVRQTLQYLRDDGLVSFVDNDGTYLRLR